MMSQWKILICILKLIGGVSKDSITLLKTNDGKFDALSIVIELYDKFNAKKEFRILDEFILYCKNKHYTLVEEVN